MVSDETMWHQRVNSTKSADANVNPEVSSAPSANANSNANIKCMRIICG